MTWKSISQWEEMLKPYKKHKIIIGIIIGLTAFNATEGGIIGYNLWKFVINTKCYSCELAVSILISHVYMYKN